MKRVFLILIFAIIIFFILKNDDLNNVQENNIKNILSNEITQNTISNLNESNKVILNENSTKQNVVNENTQKFLDGKTIAFIGDSLMEGYGNNFHGFDYYLSQDLPNTTFINNSKSGSTITDNSGTDNIIMLNQAKTLTGNPDIIVLDGGANDIMGYALGFLNQDLKKEIGTVDMNTLTISDGETVISDLEEVLLELKNRFPNAKICYFQPFLLDDDTISHLTNENEAKQEILARQNQFFIEVQKMCAKWKMEFWDVSQAFAGTGTEYRQEDWIHINEKGYQLLSPKLLNKLKEL